MKDKGLKLVLSIPAILYIGWYIWLMITNIFPICQTAISDFFKLTIWQVILVILGFTLLLFCSILSIAWLGVIWLGSEE
jgi:hypothetical protein